MHTELNLIRPWDFFGSLLAYGEARVLAQSLKLTPQTIKNWTRRPTMDANATGRKSFLHYLEAIIRYFYEEDGDAKRVHKLGDYICAQMDSVRVSIPEPGSCILDTEMLSNISTIMKESAQVINAFNKAWFIESPGEFSPNEVLAVVKSLDSLMQKAAQIRHVCIAVSS